MSVYKSKVSDKSAAAGKRMMPRAFRAKTMPAALAAVEHALGNRALIVSVHPISSGPAWQVWRRSGVEVVAMPSAVEALFDETDEPEASNGPEEKSGAPNSEEELSPGIPNAIDPDAQKAAKRRAEYGSEGSGESGSQAGSGLPPTLAGLQEHLLGQGVEYEWLTQTLQSLRERSSNQILGDEKLSRELVRQELLRRLRSDGGACLIRRKVIFLIGSSGCGKTSSCAKIASYALKALGKRVRWISSDTTRAGAIAKAQAFTAPLGIPLNLTYRPEELFSLLHRDSDADLSLVDTPGCNPYRKEELEGLDELLTGLPDRHVLWVAPATAKESDLRDMYAAYSRFGIGGVVVTRLDETRSVGELFNFLHHSQLPIAFLSHGPRIQGDLHSGEPSLLTSLLLGEKPY
jgi:flagellar biosynthesis GTPase FlhF